MLASNIPKRFWQFVLSHAAYLNNIVSPLRCDRTKTIFEVLFNRRADVRRIPSIGAFCAVYTDRRQVQDQSFGLTSEQGVFIGIARYKKVLGYVVTDGKSLFVTRDHITFDPQLLPFKLKPTTSPDWQTFYNLTNPVAEGAVTQTPTSSAPTDPMPNYASDEPDLDPDYDSSQLLGSTFQSQIYYYKFLCNKKEDFICVCFITAGPITKLFAWGEEESGGHVL